MACAGKTAFVALALALSTVAALATPIGSAAAAPFRPARDDQVLERLPAPAVGLNAELRRLRSALSRRPTDLDLALRLARDYLRAARAEADPRYAGYAQAALAPWWDEPDPPVPVLVVRAALRERRHDFAGALEDLERVLERDPRNAQAWLSRAVLLRLGGEHVLAVRSCLPLNALADLLLTATCAASVASLSGKAEASLRVLDGQLRAHATAPIEIRLWALTILAETADALGRHEAAERYFREGLGLGQRDPYLMAAFADFLLDRGRPEEVVALLRSETRATSLLMRLARAELALGGSVASGSEAADHVARLSATFEATRLRGDRPHLRSEAYFTLYLLDDPEAALALALRNFTIQREPADARLALEAALAAMQPEAAQPVLDWLSASRLEHAALAGLAARLQSPPR